jgi:hypothetical protein
VFNIWNTIKSETHFKIHLGSLPYEQPFILLPTSAIETWLYVASLIHSFDNLGQLNFGLYASILKTGICKHVCR